MCAVLGQPDSIGIEDEDAVLIERDFSGLPTGFVAVVGVLPVEADFIVIGGDPLFDALPGWLNRLEGIDFCELRPRAAQAHPAPHQVSPSRRLHAPGAVCPSSPQP